MLGSLTAYFNTGFNGVDIPASPSVLETAQKKIYPGTYYAREDIDKPYFDVADSYDNLKNCDYVSFTHNGETYYYFCVPTALAQGVTRLSLDLDALLTMGGAANLNYSSGWEERGHIAKADDELFSNVASEDWIPTQPLRVAHTGAFGKKTQQDTNSDLDVITSAVNLTALASQPEWNQTVINGVVSGETEASMYFPAIPTVQTGTVYRAYDFTDGAYKEYKLPNSGAFVADQNNIPRALKKLYSCGQLQLQASYKIPGEYYDVMIPLQSQPGQIGQLNGIHKELSASSMPYEYAISGYTVKNKKCFTTYRQFVIANLGSSDSCFKTPEELYDGQTGYPVILLWTDTSSTGKPYARFKYIKDNPIQYADAVKGLQWINNQLTMEGASGSLWNSMNAAFANSQMTREKAMVGINAGYAAQNAAYAVQAAELGFRQANTNTAFSALSQGIGAIGGMMGGLSATPVSSFKSTEDYWARQQGPAGGQLGATSTLVNLAGMLNDSTIRDQAYGIQLNQIQSGLNQSLANADNQKAVIQQSINENKVGLIKNNTLVAPQILFTPEQNLGLYGYNYFVLYEIRKTDEDLKSEDEYYQRFGYNGLHRPLTGQCFNEREYYSFVQAFNVNIKSGFGLRVRAKAISQLNSGVRVWKVLPDASYYDIN